MIKKKDICRYLFTSMCLKIKVIQVIPVIPVIPGNECKGYK